MENEPQIEFGEEKTLEIFVDQKEEFFIDVLIPVETKEEEESKPATTGDANEWLIEKPTILEGKRSRKPTARLDTSVLTPSKKELSIPQGRGKALGDIEHINQRINHATTDALSRLGQICFGRHAGLKKNVKKYIRQFQGFDFDHRSDQYEKHLKSLSKLRKDQLRSFADLLGLWNGGSIPDLAERILNFLVKPTDQTVTGRRGRKPTTIRTLKKRTVVSKRTKKSEKPVEVDEALLMNCQVKLDNVAHESEPNLLTASSLPVESTKEEPVNESHNQTDQSSINLVIDENHRTDDDPEEPTTNNTNAETIF